MTRHLRRERAQATTLQDVARRAGVASSTASYVLNNKPKAIGAATRERVLAATNEIGYRPNLAARSLVTRRTNIVALWVPNVATAFSSRVIAEMQNQARPRGYEVLICDALMTERAGEEAAPDEQASTATLRMPGWNVDGIIAFFGSSSRRIGLALLKYLQRVHSKRHENHSPQDSRYVSAFCSARPSPSPSSSRGGAPGAHQRAHAGSGA